MALPFLNGQSKKKRDQIIAIDLGSRTTKAIHLQRKGEGFALQHYVVMDAPIYEKSLSIELLSEHLKAVVQALDAKTKIVTLAIGVNDSIVRHAELPPMPVEDMRMILRNNTKNYLQQDLPGHVFDCHVVVARNGAALESARAVGMQRAKVLVGGAKQQLISDLLQSIKDAGLTADQVIPGLLGPVNALELAMPEAFAKEPVALVDIGFKSTTISLLNNGQLILSRVVAIGGDRMTQGLAEAMSISYAEAEGIKVGMPAEVQSSLEPILIPLGRELRASVDFFEHQQDKSVSQIYISGGSARSEFIIKSLEAELMVHCKAWNPVASLQNELPALQSAEIDQVAPQLAVAVGAAAVAF
ncbi:pilus assembly protein PilM [Pedosphaera parvula]|uniref:Type IV pilus assembly protein PilM n=1 Tax=Pedosphaera parvula (strain Ellin514) TaxID=320771 RepID=B9XBV3_PEDPL|nr:pilus assembly protein PilM [Pedosphaera parvula]EEF62421.1 type IV pilus assembly protein PilM [Pedosphaera parvula Ellin514]